MGGFRTPQGRRPPGSGLAEWAICMLIGAIILLAINYALGGPIP